MTKKVRRKGASGNGEAVYNDLATKLDKLTEVMGQSANWQDITKSLMSGHKNKTLNERYHDLMTAAKIQREAEALPPAEAFYLIAHSIMFFAEEREFEQKSPILEKILADICAKEKAYGSPEWEALSAEYKKVKEKILAGTFQEYGEPEMAEMYLHNQEEFLRLYEEGRKSIYERKSERAQ